MVDSELIILLTNSIKELSTQRHYLFDLCYCLSLLSRNVQNHSEFLSSGAVDIFIEICKSNDKGGALAVTEAFFFLEIIHFFFF
jgi:hypothetical protein